MKPRFQKLLAAHWKRLVEFIPNSFWDLFIKYIDQ